MNMRYELLAGDPYAGPANAKTNKTKKGQKTMKRSKDNSNVPRVTNINDLSTTRILTHLVYKHRVGLLITALVLSWAWFIVTGFPVAIANAR